MKLIAGGATADVLLDGNDRLIKLFKGNFSKEAVQKEADNQKIIYEIGLPVPEIYEIIEFEGRHGIMMEYIKGISLGEKLLKNNNYVNGINTEENIAEKIEDIMRYFNIIIDLQIKVNSVKLKEFPLMKDKHIRQISVARYLDNKQKKIFLDKLEKIEYKNNLCHGDMHPFNLIETEEGIKIIDWADAAIGNREADICRSYFIYRINYLEIGNKYLEMYCEKTKVKKEKIIEYEPVIMAARLSENISEEESSRILDKLKKYM